MNQVFISHRNTMLGIDWWYDQCHEYMSFFTVMGPHAFCIPRASRYFYIMFSTPYAYVLVIMNNMTRIKYVRLIGTLCRVLMLGISCILYGRCIEILPHYDQYRHIPYNIYVPYDIMRVFSLHGIWQCECAQARRGRPTEYSYTNPPGGQCAHS